VVHHVRRRRHQDLERAVEPAAEVGHQHLDLGSPGESLAGGLADAVDEVLRAAVAQVVTVDLVMTTYEASARRWSLPGSPARRRSSGSGRPWPTSQNGQRRVHLSPMIMKVAVPLPKHSPMLGQEASSHTVWQLVLAQDLT
jgi:hypothetical protein